MSEERILTVLNVDDYPAALYATTRLLRQAGFNVLEAATGTDALARASETPDLIILDVNLPDVDGFEVCRRIKADPRTASIPVLQMSAAYRGSEHRAQGLEGGADAYLAQPVEPRELLATVRALLRVRRAENELRESEERFRTLVGATADVFWTVGPGGMAHVDVPQWRALTGQTADEMSELGWIAAIHPDDRRPDGSVWGEEVCAGGVLDVELRIRIGGGSYRLFSVRGVPILNAEGEVREWVGVCVDVDDRRRADDRQRFFGDAGAVLAAAIDERRMLTSLAELAVPLLADWFAVEVESGEGDPVVVASSSAVPVVKLAEGALEDGHALVVTDTAAGPRALGVRSHLAVPLVARGERLGVLRMAMLDSGRTMGPADARTAEEVARRLALAVDNARLYTVALEANETKSAFLATMSHELRTPMNAILGYADLLDAEVAGPLTDAQRGQLTRISASARHLLQLIDEILTFSRIEAGREQVSVERFDLGALARDTSALVDPMAHAKGLRFPSRVPLEPVWMVSDPGKVRQILLNLLSNAVKFTDSGEVRLTVRVHEERAVMEIQDTGIGIAPEQLGRVFDAFWQVEQSSTRRAGGTGLGLSVTRQLVSMLGGEVLLRSAPGEGSTFTVELPLEFPAGELAPAPL
ncbi:MAG TPA: ATP-binding protein [Longimicrobium sp.]|nr:ATP-binding protein [Longimicrobium sp.]